MPGLCQGYRYGDQFGLDETMWEIRSKWKKNWRIIIITNGKRSRIAYNGNLDDF